jgi:hypothetical protein
MYKQTLVNQMPSGQVLEFISTSFTLLKISYEERSQNHLRKYSIKNRT